MGIDSPAQQLLIDFVASGTIPKRGPPYRDGSVQLSLEDVIGNRPFSLFAVARSWGSLGLLEKEGRNLYVLAPLSKCRAVLKQRFPGLKLPEGGEWK